MSVTISPKYTVLNGNVYTAVPNPTLHRVYCNNPYDATNHYPNYLCGICISSNVTATRPVDAIKFSSTGSVIFIENDWTCDSFYKV